MKLLFPMPSINLDKSIRKKSRRRRFVVSSTNEDSGIMEKTSFTTSTTSTRAETSFLALRFIHLTETSMCIRSSKPLRHIGRRGSGTLKTYKENLYLLNKMTFLSTKQLGLGCRKRLRISRWSTWKGRNSPFNNYAPTSPIYSEKDWIRPNTRSTYSSKG